MPGGPETAAIGPAWDAIKCSLTFCCTRGDYFVELEENLTSLITERQLLQTWKEQVETRVRNELRPNLQQASRVTDWLARVQAGESNLQQVIEEGQEENQKKCSRWFFPKRCCAYNGVGNRVRDKLRAVTELRRDGNFDSVVEEKPAAPADELPTDSTVGLSLKLTEVWRWIEDPGVGVIGVCGIGGVGKTTLLKEVNNSFCGRTHNFEAVILIEVSTERDVRKVQDSLYKKLAMAEGNDWWHSIGTSDRAVWIMKFLRTKRFALLLDDVWEPWEQAALVEVGVPINGNGNSSKIIFTARSEMVCTRMKADRTTRLEGLDEVPALRLFHSYVGQDTLHAHSDILELSNRVANKCQGLPLALVTVGRAMAGKRYPWEWEDAVKRLETDPSKIPGVADHVFRSLRFSLDCLRDDRWSQGTLQMCFLYCSLFADNKMIRKDELVELWIGEGFLTNSANIYDARNEGHSIIGVLKLACLLEIGEPDDYVKMHDIIRELAIWLGENEHQILVQDLRSRRWTEAARISMWGPNVGDGNLSESPPCPKVQSLIIRDSKLSKFPIDLLKSMATLGVLNLSGNRSLTALPPAIGAFICLHYLNLSGTKIVELPSEVAKLDNLKILLVDYTPNLKHFPKGSISSIPSLEVFSKLSDDERYDDRALLEELECMENISDISVCIFRDEALKKIIASPKLQDSIRQLSLLSSETITDGTPSLAPVSTLRKMKHLERLLVNDCHRLEFSIGQNSSQIERSYRQFSSLRQVCIWYCRVIPNLGWLESAKGLQTLELFYCSKLAEVLSCDSGTEDAGESDNKFLNLTDLVLGNLPVLTSICGRVLSFPRLKKIGVHDCPQLRRLPFDSSSAKNLKEIKGSRIWWDGLEWHNHDVKDVFSSKFIPV